MYESEVMEWPSNICVQSLAFHCFLHSAFLVQFCVLHFFPLQVRLHFLASQICSQSWSLHSRCISHTSTLSLHFCFLQLLPLQFRLHLLALQICSQSWLLHSRSISHASPPSLRHFCSLQLFPLQFSLHVLALQVWSQSSPLHSSFISHTSSPVSHVCLHPSPSHFI